MKLWWRKSIKSAYGITRCQTKTSLGGTAATLPDCDDVLAEKRRVGKMSLKSIAKLRILRVQYKRKRISQMLEEIRAGRRGLRPASGGRQKSTYYLLLDQDAGQVYNDILQSSD